MCDNGKTWSVETMSISATINALEELGQYLCQECNNNYGQGVCERAVELLKDKAADKLIRSTCRDLIKERGMLIDLLTETGVICDCLYNGLDEYWITTVIGKKTESNYNKVMKKIEKVIGD